MKNKNLIKISSINIVLKFFSLGLIFLFQSLLSKYISVEFYSLFSKFIIYSNYLSLLFSFGLSASLLYFSDSNNKFLTSYLNIVILYLVIGLIMIFIYYSIQEIPFIYLYIIIFSIILNIITISLAYYQFIEAFIIYASWSALQSILIFSILGFLLLGYLLNIDEILKTYIIINSCYLVFIIYKIILKNRRNITFSINLNSKYFTYGIKIVSLLIISQFIYITDYILIDYYLEDKYLAYYFVAMIISKIIFTLADTAGNILFPLYAKAKNSSTKIDKINNSVYILSSIIFFISIIFLSLFVLLGKDLIELFYNIEYKASYFSGIMLIAGTQGMIIYKLLSRRLAVENNWKSLYIAVVSASILNILLNLFLIPKYGINGAAFSSMISYWSCGILLIFISDEKLLKFLFFYNGLKSITSPNP